MFKYRNIKADVDEFDLCVQQRGGSRKGGWYSRASAHLRVLVFLLISPTSFTQEKRIIKNYEIQGEISPKSIVASGNGLFAVQNMMYRHTVTIYDKYGNRKAKISDAVNLKSFGFSQYKNELYLGGPVEAVFAQNGDYLWVSNYSMIGDGFDHPGCDACSGDKFDPGFLYKINTETYEIDNVVRVGAVPKFIAISNDEKKLLVSNWSSGDVSIVDLEKEKEIKRVKIGMHPRGIDITTDSETAFVTVMGSARIAEIDLNNYDVTYIRNVGRGPRHLILDNTDSVLYVSMNLGGEVLKYNRFTEDREVCKTSSGPRSMCMTPEGDFIYVVNYFDNTFSKIQTSSMDMVEEVKTSAKPIGICGNWEDSEVWVACYSGSLEVFKDFHLDSLRHGTGTRSSDLSSFWAFDSIPFRSNDQALNSAESTQIVSVKMVILHPKELLSPIERNRFPKTIKELNDCQYHVIAGSFSIPNNATRRKKELIEKGYPARIISANLSYVSAHCFQSRNQAEEEASRVRNKTGYSAWILKR